MRPYCVYYLGEEREKGAKGLFKEIMVENSLNLGK